MVTRRRIPHLLLAGLLTLMLAVSACGGKDKPAVCTDVTNLESSISAVTKIKIDQGALTELKTKLAQVQTDATQLKKDAQAEFGTEVDAVTAAASAFKTALDAAVAAPSTTTITAVIAAVPALTTALSNLQTAVKTTC
jgi:vancomycin resistance protein YoaR